MSSRDRSEAIRRLEVVARRLRSAVAFARLLSELEEEDDNASPLAERAQAALAEIEEEQRAVSRFLGPRAFERLREAEIGCNVLLRQLGEREALVAPAALRRALRRWSRRPPHELVELLGFFLEESDRWTADRVDKVDLLLTQLVRLLGGSDSRPGGEQLSQILAASLRTSHRPIGELERSTFQRKLEAIAAEVDAADSLSRLIESGTIQRYRELKHRLGPLLLHPDLLSAIVETNQGLRRKIRRLNSRTLTGIFSVYQGIFEIGLRGGIDRGLRREIEQLQLDFDAFEERVKQNELKLTELEEVWGNLRSFSARLEEAAAERPEPEPEPRRAADEEQVPANWLSEDLMALLDLLRESDSKGWPAEFVSLPAREHFQIDAREIKAFRRLETREEADRSLEAFLLKAAALRRVIKRSARKLAGAPDTDSLRELPDYAIARQAVRLSESFLARYAQAVEQAILDGDAEDARRLQILRMRLVRESAGIWLQVYEQT